MVKVDKILLFTNGQIIRKNMQAACIGYKDIMEKLRQALNENTLDNIQEIFVVRSEQINFIKK